VITDGSANVLSSNLYDNFGAEMYASGSAATQWRFVGRFVEEEGLVAAAGGGGDMLVGRGLALKPPPPAKKRTRNCKEAGMHACGAAAVKAWCRKCCASHGGAHACCCSWERGKGLTKLAICTANYFCLEMPEGAKA